jgi:hypothetical protein
MRSRGLTTSRRSGTIGRERVRPNENEAPQKLCCLDGELPFAYHQEL